MKYISHIKELVSGILDNETVTRYPEAYDALTALYNHLDTLEEVQKYMPYKDPGPVIQKLEQSLAKANTDRIHIRELYIKENTSNIKISQDLKDAQAEIQELTRTKDLYEVAKHKLLQSQSQIENLNKELEKKNKSRDQCYQYWQEYKSKNETLEQKNQELRKVIEDLNKENAYYRNTLEQKDQAIDDTIETFKKENQELQTQIENLKGSPTSPLYIELNNIIKELRAERKDLEKKNQDLRSQLKEVNEYYHNHQQGEE